MRQLKTFMRNRKEDILGCGDCSCYTLQCWRNSDVNCGCGDSEGQEYLRLFGIPARRDDIEGKESDVPYGTISNMNVTAPVGAVVRIEFYPVKYSLEVGDIQQAKLYVNGKLKSTIICNPTETLYVYYPDFYLDTRTMEDYLEFKDEGETEDYYRQEYEVILGGDVDWLLGGSRNERMLQITIETNNPERGKPLFFGRDWTGETRNCVAGGIPYVNGNKIYLTSRDGTQEGNPINATPETGYVFVRWDGVPDENGWQNNTTVTATFTEGGR